MTMLKATHSSIGAMNPGPLLIHNPDRYAGGSCDLNAFRGQK